MCGTIYCVFFFNDTATTEIYTLSLHDALPICSVQRWILVAGADRPVDQHRIGVLLPAHHRQYVDARRRSQDRKSTRLNSRSRQYLVCRLLLEKKKSNPGSTILHTARPPDPHPF